MTFESGSKIFRIHITKKIDETITISEEQYLAQESM